jgi:hypothetical protein
MSAGDAHLYGVRAPKNQKKEISSSTTLAFTSQLSSLLSSSSSNARTSTGRTRPTTKSDIFTSHNKNSKKRAARDLEDDVYSQNPRQDIGNIDDTDVHRSKRKMEHKARLYAAMKRGDHVPKEGEAESLIDFDRKWAENEARGGGNEYETESDDAGDSDDGEMVEYEDEYGRLRKGTKAERDRMERKKTQRVLGAEELDRMSARPNMPSNVIYGDVVQTAAFNPDELTTEKMEELARKRDRSLTPPEMKHYEADKEIRNKGTGFYSFSKDEGTRQKEMEALEKERLETERVRKEREERKEKRRKEIEERRKAIGEKRAKKQAESFLDSLEADIGGDS